SWKLTSLKQQAEASVPSFLPTPTHSPSVPAEPTILPTVVRLALRIVGANKTDCVALGAVK
ncbi:hypothetical protein JMJ77_0006234, partial [Colletotrichum scovillei]